MTTNSLPKDEPSDSKPSTTAGRPARQRLPRLLLVTGGLIVAVALVTAIVASGDNREAAGNPMRTSLAEITRQTLTSHIAVDGILGYGEAIPVGARKPGTVTWLPPIGASVEQGESLYRLDERPVPLLYGNAPMYRTLRSSSQGLAMEGTDVRQLQENLRELGYAGFEVNGRYDDATADAVRAWQNALGLEATGAIEVGDLVFLPEAVRVVAYSSRVGDAVGGGGGGPGSAVLQVTGTTPIVTVALDPSLQSRVSLGDSVTITLPGRQRSEGIVTDIGSVANAAERGGEGGRGGGASINVEVELTNPDAAGRLDQAPVSLSIITATVEDVLVVPVTALFAMAGGGHAVEVEHADGRRELIPVATGLFDTSRGLVQVDGENISHGQQVVVPGR